MDAMEALSGGKNLHADGSVVPDVFLETGQLLLESVKYANLELLRDLLSQQQADVQHVVFCVDKPAVFGGKASEDLNLADKQKYANFRDQTNGYTLLHYAAGLKDISCAHLLIMAGADVNGFVNVVGKSKTPLHIAAQCGNVEMCKLLVSSGADVFACDQDGYSSLEVSQMHDNHTVAHVLLDAIGLDCACIACDLPLVEKIVEEAGETFLPLIIHGHREDYSLLCKACERGNLNLVEMLLKYGADGRSHPFTLYSPLYIALQRGYLEIARILIKHFPDLVQCATFEKGLPIHAVAQTGRVDCARLMLDAENYPPTYSMPWLTDTSNKFHFRLPFDPNAQDVNCQTPLFIACCSQQVEMVQFLLNIQVDAQTSPQISTKIDSPPNALDGKMRRSANDDADVYEDVLHCALAENAIVTDDQVEEALDTVVQQDDYCGESLAKFRSKLNASNTENFCNINPTGLSAPAATKLIKPVALDVYSTKGVTSLHAAIGKGNFVIAKMLVDAGADVNLPLALSDEEMKKIMQQQSPANQQQANEEIFQICGSGALIETCKLKNVDFLLYLLEKGAVDHENKALRVCTGQNFDQLSCALLTRRVFVDPEFRVNKKHVEIDQTALQQLQNSASGRTVVLPSLMYPSSAVMLNWHSASLTKLLDDWLLQASLHLNKKLANCQASNSIALAAITRLDLAKNRLSTVPPSVFQLTSLRILNLSHNSFESLPTLHQWHLPVLEEIHLEYNKLENLPDVIFRLPNLQALDVSNNRLTNLPSNLWNCWPNFTKLKDLNVSYNRLKSLPLPENFWHAANRPADNSTCSKRSSNHSEEEQVLNSLSNFSGGPSTDITGIADDLDDLRSWDSLRLGRCEDMVTYQELKRQNIWQKNLELCKVQDEDEQPTSAGLQAPNSTQNFKTAANQAKCSLTSLNLCHNELERVPEFLPCLAPQLGRLTLSQNRLSELGPINCYPSRLKHLDVSNNKIERWFAGPVQWGACPLCPVPVGPVLPAGGTHHGPFKPHSPAGPRRSQSLARGGPSNVRSLSVAPSGLHRMALGADPTSSPFFTPSPLSYCSHRRHSRLENLRTLVLAGNRLDVVCLTTDADERGSRAASSASTRTATPTTGTGGVPRRSSGGGAVAIGRRRPSGGGEAGRSPAPVLSKSEISFPHLSMLDVSSNLLRYVPPEISCISTLSVLNLSNNPQITNLPPEMGLLNRLWNLNLAGCNLCEPLKSMLDSKRYKTMDVVGYLKSILEDSKCYARLKLMIVGVQGIGKTTLLEQLRPEGSGTYRKQQPEAWAKRMGNKNINQKTNRGVNISTVGVDLNDWTYEPKRSKQNGIGPITFRTWDFGGQREYYATHQYFLSRRSLYLVVWRVTDGEAGINEITQWLVNIQARAPNSPVIIVGTHYDEILSNSRKFPPSYVEDLQLLIREKFVAVQDADKKGLPKVIDSVIISCKTRFNIRVLCDLIYHTAMEQRAPGAKDRLLEQKIPASYVALEEVVGQLASERKQRNEDPVLTATQYKTNVQELMKKQFGKQFRDTSELNQATAFLHDNGVLLHYDDATLKDLYFLDPQWLCDILAHVITIREINPFAKNGLMKTDDLKILFKSSKFSPSNIRSYILNLIQKFEVALTWDNRTLLIPSLLPDEYQLRGGYPDCEVKIPLRSRGWIVKSSQNFTESNKNTSTIKNSSPKNDVDQSILCSTSKNEQFIPLFTLNRGKKSGEELGAEFYANFVPKDDACLRRLYAMAYVPSGFWSRLIARLLGDEVLPNLFDEFFRFVGRQKLRLGDDSKLSAILNANKPEWLLWQSGVEVKFLNQTLFCVREFLPLAEIRDFNYKEIKFKCRAENCCSPLSSANLGTAQFSAPLQNLDLQHVSIIEIVVPSLVLNLRYQDSSGHAKLVALETDLQPMTKLLAMVVDTLDTLLEDWYPSLGTRFVHTSEGKYLVSRLVPCPYCLLLQHSAGSTSHPYRSGAVDDQSAAPHPSAVWTVHSLNRKSAQRVVCDESGTLLNPVDVPLVAQPDGRVIKSKTFDSSIADRPRRGSTSSQDSGMNESSGLDTEILTCVKQSASLNDMENNASKLLKPLADFAYAFTIEELILAAYEATLPSCTLHGPMTLSSLAPDLVFLDLNPSQLVVTEQVKRTKMLGRGAFGFVFKATVKFKGQNSSTDVALKMLQPVNPGFSVKQSAVCAYKAAWSKWQRDPIQYACRSYTTARQELSILLHLKHPNVVPLLGVCTKPLALTLGLAPCGSLSALLQSYKRSGAFLNVTVIQETAAQVSKALEYLHQQHIIYRDLKSDNVLVWQFPPAFSKLTNVELKLGDYGISRSVLPTGGAKGFGGTEGYMAPEIMRYNGEEEYTEKVDCFSFGMFLYELLTLKLPFEGHEQVKEYILDGGRPILTAKELLYPSNMVDLMVVCWSQQPSERPSSSQLVSITTAPEFAHLLDAVSLNSSDAAIISGEAFVVIDDTCSNEDISQNQLDGETWLSRADGLISILSCNQHGWMDYKNVTVNEESFVTSLCLVEDTIWMGELTGLIRVFCIKTYAEVVNFSLAPHVLPNDHSPRHQCSLQTVDMFYVPLFGAVLICMNKPGALLLCMLQHVLAGNFDDCIACCVKSSEDLGPIGCCAAVLLPDMTYAVWCGHSAGYLSIFGLKSQSTNLTHLGTINHYSPVVEGVEVSRLVSSPNNGRYVWSYIYPGCVLYQWDVSQRVIVSKLDCSKIVPCSESINTLNIEERLNPGRCQVTALTLVEKEECTQLYIGTTWGVLIVTEADQLKPITALRPHFDEIRVIVPVNQQKRATVGLSSSTANQNRPSVTSARSRVSSEGVGSNPSLNVKNYSNPGYVNAVKKLSQSRASVVTSSSFDSAYVVTIGKGYRGLINRFLDVWDQKDDPTVVESRTKDFFAVLWRTDDWFNG